MQGSSAGEGGIYNSINLSLYHYGGNNPIRYSDPTGLFDWDTNTIESGDTLNQIAKDCNTRYGTNYTADDLQGLNSDTISDKDKIYAGNHLNLGKADDVQKRAADYINRATTRYSNEQVTPPEQKKGFSRGANVLIGIGEIVGGVCTWVVTTIVASSVAVKTEGASLYFAGVSVRNGFVLGSLLVGYGSARVVGVHNAPVFDDIVNAAMPVENDIANTTDNMSKKKKE